MEEFSRLIALIGEENFNKLQQSRIVIVGLGGVGGYVAEGLARSGVGHFMLIDDDVVNVSNINRQIIATHSNIGKSKVLAWKERISDINPLAKVEAYNCRYSYQYPMDFGDVDYVVDAIDSIKDKVGLIVECDKKNLRIISCMGTGGKLDANFKVCDLYSTSYDPLARKLRKLLRQEGVNKLKVVYSDECPQSLCSDENGRQVPSTISYSPSIAGMILVKEIIKDIIE